MSEPWGPADYKPADAEALNALAEGRANAHQQKLAIDWIIRFASMTYDQSFYPSDPHVTSFIEGRRSVGNQIIKLIKTIPKEMKRI